ncbi:hypothetical protein [Nitrosophilus labii]|uniref:hypothetical protein n=1 Tax=Nitrosophilus labii TaxID=2706014 RepID=UPI0016571525|nr:hypothetical protein [Nitrosophilus labii]
MIKQVEKKELLEELEEVQSGYKNLDFKFLIMVILTMFIVFLLAFPKIYIRNHIYYTSKNINKLLDEYQILKEENRLLKQKLEYMRFKNQVLDTLF